MTRQFRYSRRSLGVDYAVGAGGAGCSLGLLAFAEPAAPVAWFATAAAALFLVYFARTVCRQRTRIELDGTGIRASGPLAVAIRWDSLRSLRLDYYSTRRDAGGRTMQGGWLQLRLEDGRSTMRVDSGLEGFADLAMLAARESARRGLAPDAATAHNLQALRR